MRQRKRAAVRRIFGAATVLAVCAWAGAGAAQPVPATENLPPHPPGTFVTRVRRGDTCAAIAARVYNSPTRVDVIHRYNPSVCPPAGALLPGMFLILPRSLGRRPRAVPVAVLTVVNNRVMVQASAANEPREGRPNDPIFRAARVSTAAQSSAELSFSNRARIRLYESSMLVVLGDASPRVRRLATAQDTTLVNGTLRTFLSELARPRRGAPAPRPLTIRTGGAQVVLRPGESQITIEPAERPTTTLAVYRGASALRSGAQVVAVPEGFGARAVRGQRIAPPRRLPPAPTWEARPPAVLFAGPDVALVGRTRAGDGVEAGEWHVEIARDERFAELIADRHVPAADDAVRVPSVEPGTYYARVSTLDRERFEGTAGEVARTVVVVPRFEPADAPTSETLVLPEGLACSLDGASFEARVVVDRTQAHALRCALAADPATAAETAIPATQSPPPPPPAPAPPPPPPPPPRPVPREGFAQRLSLRVEGQYVTTVSTPPAGVSLDHGGGGTLRLGLDLRRPPIGSAGLVFGVEVFGATAIFPQPSGARASSWPVGAALRLTPYTGRVQPWVSAGAAAVFTGSLVRPGVEAGLGLDVRLAPAVLLGAVVRYGQVIETDANSGTGDARTVHVGLALTLRLPYSAGRP